MADSKQAGNAQTKRRKRVNRLKTLIVFLAVLLLLASVILNFVLVFKVFELQNKVDKLYSMTPAMVTLEVL
ncbi:MAG: hypothetical protein K2L07_13875 [Lachnospiraceae bacterium]|nr:hypothetical protein [Lachnospiraceae bacterium]